MTPRELHWGAAGEERNIRIEEARGHGTFHISGRSIPFRRLADDRIEIDGKIHRFYVVRSGAAWVVWLDGRTYRLERIDKSRSALAATAAAAATGTVTALMPGKLLRLEVAVGDTVVEKQTLAIMESMKMESSLHAPKAGRVAEIRCQPGQVVEMGEVLMIVE